MSITKEVWVDIEGFCGIYQISNYGKIKNSQTGKLLSTFSDRDGYLVLGIYKEKKQHRFFVHRLIAQAFIPNPNNYPCINHKDEIKNNNNIDNLEWCTNKYNANYGTRGKRLGETQSIPVVQKTKFGEIIKTYKSRLNAQIETGISKEHICDCANGRRKTAGGFVWENQINRLGTNAHTVRHNG